MLSFLTSLFTGKTVGAVERVASEWIETAGEKAEAGALMIKTLDPNGLMRRELSRFACIAYGYYLFITSICVLTASFGIGNVDGALQAAELMAGLFTPITTAWGAIVSASFGVNGINSFKGR